MRTIYHPAGHKKMEISDEQHAIITVVKIMQGDGWWGEDTLVRAGNRKIHIKDVSLEPIEIRQKLAL